jgi:hypothetical protein
MVSLVTAPVTGTNGEILGVLAGALNMNRENMLGSVARLKLGETGYFFMTSWDNTLVMHPDASLLMPRIPPGACWSARPTAFAAPWKPPRRTAKPCYPR